MLNTGSDNTINIDYYYKPPLDPLMGDTLITDLESESLSLSEQEIREQRLSPARYNEFNISTGTANRFVRFDNDNDNFLSSISFDNVRNKVTALDAMNGLYYECGPGTPTNNRGESICVNPSNNFIQPNNHRLPPDITGKHIIHLEHDNDKKIVYYNDGNGNFTLKKYLVQLITISMKHY